MKLLRRWVGFGLMAGLCAALSGCYVVPIGWGHRHGGYHGGPRGGDYHQEQRGPRDGRHRGGYDRDGRDGDGGYRDGRDRRGR